MKALAALLLVAVVLTGCMTTSPKSYQSLARESHFVFQDDVMVANKVSSGLAKGTYRSVFESADHTYYLGEPKALIMPNGVRVSGGIALPKAGSSHGCHIFIQVGDDSAIVREQEGGALVAELAKLEAGRIREFKNDPTCSGFITRIQLIDGLG